MIKIEEVEAVTTYTISGLTSHQLARIVNALDADGVNDSFGQDLWETIRGLAKSVGINP